MTHTYTPGLTVTARTRITRRRILPLAGSVLVKAAANVTAETIVARAELPGDVTLVNAVSRLGCAPDELAELMLKSEGDEVRAGEVIAETRPWIKLFRSELKSPIDGVLESVSSITGQLILRGKPKPVEISAYCDGRISEVVPDAGVVVETVATFVQGILGIGGEISGPLVMACRQPDQQLTQDLLQKDHRDKILVGGSFVSGDTLQQAVALGVAGVVVGGFHDRDLRALLGYDLGVAITGHEQAGITLIMTEGFGQIPMRDGTFNLLKSRCGCKASINGATQIRAGVMRPEIIVPWTDSITGEDQAATKSETGLEVGSPVRVIRQPYFGRLGTVVDLPAKLTEIPTGALARVAQVEFDEQQTAVIPRANLEMIEE